MTVLLGQEAEGVGVTASVVTENSHTFKFTALATGQVTALHMIFSESGTGTSCNLAIQANEAGTPKDGVLVEGSVASTAAGAHEVAVAETEVVEGTAYWLTFQPQGGTAKYKQAATTVRRIDGTKHKKISETKNSEWGAEAAKGPISIWATGTVGLPLTGKATGAMLLTGTAKGTAEQVVTGKATGAIHLGGTAKAQTAEVLKGKSTGHLLFTGTAHGTAGGPTFGKASGTLTLRGTAKGSAKEVSTRRSAIFIFED